MDINFRVEVATRLQVIDQVPLTLIQQIVIHGILFVNRDLSPQGPAADVVPARVNHDHRAGIDLESEVHRITGSMIKLLGD